MRALAPLALSIALSACGPSYLGPIALEITPTDPLASEDVRIVAPVSRAVETFQVTATNGAETLTFDSSEMESEPYLIEGRTYTLWFPAEHTARDEVWTLTAIGTVGRGELRGTAEITIKNTPPNGTVTLGPAEPTRRDTLVATSDFADADGDAFDVSYTWFVNGDRIDNIGPELPPLQARRNDRVRVVARANDGTDDGPEATAEITLRNAPPTVQVELSPADAHTGSTLVALASGNDVDGDELTFEYSWEINGEQLPTTTDELMPALHRRDDVVRVRAVARDGRTLSEPAFDEITIQNSPPSMPEIAIQPERPSVTRDLVCGLTTPAVDADGDPLTYLFTWRRDGAAYTGATSRTVHTGDTVPASVTREGELWSCAASVSDGDAVVGPTAWTPEAEIGPPVAVFTFKDTSAADVSATALRDFFNDVAVAPTDYIFFEVKAAGRGGAWCATRADWYKDNYVRLGGGSSTATSSGWNKWQRSEGGSWVGPTTAGYTNYFGSGCASSAWNWCSEWGFGRSLGVMPGRSGDETYANGWGGSVGWEFTLKVAPTRADACDF